MSATPIETSYAGYRFRSRVEARWAVFFDMLNLPWSYEVEGYHLGEAGEMYLPDFRVIRNLRQGEDYSAQREMWIEIKGYRPTEDEIRKLTMLCESQDREGYLMVDDPINAAVTSVYPSKWKRDGRAGADTVCSILGTPYEETLRAGHAARAARFEHGESGAPVAGVWVSN